MVKAAIVDDWHFSRLTTPGTIKRNISEGIDSNLIILRWALVFARELHQIISIFIMLFAVEWLVDYHIFPAEWLRICGSLGLTYGLFNLMNPPQIVAERGWAQEAWAGGCHGRPKKAWTDEARSLLGNVLCVGCPQLLVIRNYEFV